MYFPKEAATYTQKVVIPGLPNHFDGVRECVGCIGDRILESQRVRMEVGDLR